MMTRGDKKSFWRRLEEGEDGAPLDAEEARAALRVNADGLLPVIAQCADSGRVLMLAWMNQAALERTLATGQMTYFSRSRQALWRKGETSGNTQRLVSLAADCDGDALLARVTQSGDACHTGRLSCFYAQLAPAACLRGADD